MKARHRVGVARSSRTSSARHYSRRLRCQTPEFPGKNSLGSPQLITAPVSPICTASTSAPMRFLSGKRKPAGPSSLIPTIVSRVVTVVRKNVRFRPSGCQASRKFKRPCAACVPSLETVRSQRTSLGWGDDSRQSPQSEPAGGLCGNKEDLQGFSIP